jgi:hypothetical protein
VVVHGLLASGERIELARTASVGYQRVLRFAPVEVTGVEFEVRGYRGPFVLQAFSAYAG